MERTIWTIFLGFNNDCNSCAVILLHSRLFLTIKRNSLLYTSSNELFIGNVKLYPAYFEMNVFIFCSKRTEMLDNGNSNQRVEGWIDMCEETLVWYNDEIHQFVFESITLRIPAAYLCSFVRIAV